MSTSVTVLVPSRGRPGNLKRLVDAVAATAPGAHVIARVDDDDPHLGEYLDLVWADVVVGPRAGFVAAVNELAVWADRNYLMIVGDDVLPETPGWADAMIDALDGRPGIAYGDDGLRHKHAPDLPTHPMMHRDLAARIGWAALPTCRHLFPDNAWRDLGIGLGNFPFVDVKLTHLHPWAGKAPRDQTYTDANNRAAADLDRAAYEAWRDGSWGLSRVLASLQ